jgi:hypothetical protein
MTRLLAPATAAVRSAGRGRLRRWIAACVGVWLLACAWLTAHHTAAQPHVRDSRGRAVHAVAAASEVAPLDLGAGHQLRRVGGHEPDHAACPLTQLPGAAALPGGAPAAATGRPPTAPTRAVPASPRVAAALYRLAPKTSPPSPSRSAST